MVPGDSPSRFQRAEYAAPMVRASILPFREECLRYGASYVFTEELIDKKVINSFSEICDDGTVLFLTEKDKGRTVQFNPESSSRTILQVGTADGVLASKAALKLIEYVSEVNVNMGCPKPFSISGGMGAALLSKPELARDIVKTLRSELPEGYPLSCKIRYLGENSDYTQMLRRTSEFIVGLIDAGADSITVHMRTVPMRPREPAIWSVFTDLLHAIPSTHSRVPIIANGDFFERSNINTFREMVSLGMCETGRSWSDSVMIGRGAMWNPSIFCAEKPVSPEMVVNDFFDACLKYNEPKSSVKWSLSQMMEGTTALGGRPMKEIRDLVYQAKTLDDLQNAIKTPLTTLSVDTLDKRPKRVKIEDS